MPHWNEAETFTTTDLTRDSIRVDAYNEHRKSKDEYLGSAEYPLEKLLRKRLMEMELRNGKELTGSYVTLKCVQLLATNNDEIGSELDTSLVLDDNDSLSLLSVSGPSSSFPSRPTTLSMNSEDKSDSSSCDTEDDVFSQSLPPGPTWRKTRRETDPDKSVPNHKVLMRKLSLPLHMQQKFTSPNLFHLTNKEKK
eukprot:CAMPEP_0202002982 /NCGR_PEP_ID=MMETSP0905-20130828/8696_1 /ASSEMBLY_ACC=CAM_ASM_000554 /TAXON_ID=420261 /ORGANISM="Thalassiosira antarctica, Strain CCMP982" /LENGTH=194 /DNA_ID=CAMNT_0048560041 /DNA_START=153 /DNA_END=737 /DNA_ORIENTATION=-